MVVEEGETDVEPLVALLVEKLVPVHEEAFVELQVSVEELPLVIDEGEAARDAVGVEGGVPLMTSSAPMSQAVPWGRVSPSMSVVKLDARDMPTSLAALDD